MPMLDDATQTQVRDLLEPLEHEVELIVYKGGSLIVPGQDPAGHQKKPSNCCAKWSR